MKEFLSRKGVSFVEHDVSRDTAAADEMVRRSRQRGVPVIVIDDQVVVGFDRPLLEQLLSRPRGASLGVRTADAARVAERLGLSVASGAYLGSVHRGSAAERAGLRAGDVIVELAGTSVRDADGLKAALASLAPGPSVRIVWVRGSARMEGETLLQTE